MIRSVKGFFLYIYFLPVALAILVGYPLRAQDRCADILENGIYDVTQVDSSQTHIRNVQHQVCSSTSGSSNDGWGFGLDVAAVVEAIPFQLGGVFRKDDERKWLDQACTYDWEYFFDTAERKANVSKASQVIVDAWRNCMGERSREALAFSPLFVDDKNVTFELQMNIEDVSGIKVRPRGLYTNPPKALNCVDDIRKLAKGGKRRTLRVRCGRATDEAFEVAVDAHYYQPRIHIPKADNRVVVKPIQPTFLKDLTPMDQYRVHGNLQRGTCYNNKTVKFSNNKLYNSSLGIHPECCQNTFVVYAIPAGAKRFKVDAIGFCIDGTDCFQRTVISDWWIYADTTELAKGRLEGPHNTAPVAAGIDADITGKRTIRIDVSDYDMVWCDHVTFGNARFE